MASAFATQPFLQLPTPVKQNVSECLTVIAFCLESCHPGGADVHYFSATVTAAVEALVGDRNVLLCDNERIVYA